MEKAFETDDEYRSYLLQKVADQQLNEARIRAATLQTAMESCFNEGITHAEILRILGQALIVRQK